MKEVKLTPIFDQEGKQDFRSMYNMVTVVAMILKSYEFEVNAIDFHCKCLLLCLDKGQTDMVDVYNSSIDEILIMIIIFQPHKCILF